MRIFIDSADTEAIKRCWDTGLIDGCTTNPTLISKSGRDPRSVYDELAEMGVPDISMEVMGNAVEMQNEAMKLYTEYKEVATIKLPMCQDGLKVCKELSNLGIRTNVTLIFNAAQAILAAKAGANYVSPFVGRIDDQGYAGTEVVRSIVGLYQQQRVSTEVLAASIRTTQRLVRAFYSGATVVTIPPGVFWNSYQHVLTDVGLSIFEKDANG